jgi:hypothetical protein
MSIKWIYFRPMITDIRRVRIFQTQKLVKYLKASY